MGLVYCGVLIDIRPVHPVDQAVETPLAMAVPKKRLEKGQRLQ